MSVDSILRDVLGLIELRASDDSVKSDLEVTCARCEDVLCDAEHGDSLGVLVSTALGHLDDCRGEPLPVECADELCDAELDEGGWNGYCYEHAPDCGADFMAGTICSLPAGHVEREGTTHAPICRICGGDWYAGTCTCNPESEG